MRRFKYTLLDASDRPLGTLDGVTGGRAEVVAQAPLGGSGSLTLDERGQGIDWLSHRLRVEFEDVDFIEHPGSNPTLPPGESFATAVEDGGAWYAEI